MDGVDGGRNSRIHGKRPPEKTFWRTDRFMDCRGIEWHSCRDCAITNNLDGSEDDLVYENSEEPIDGESFVREIFVSDSESDFEGFDA